MKLAKGLSSVAMTLLLGACTTTTAAGIGKTQSGEPVTGQYTQAIIDAKYLELSILFVSASGAQCSANEKLRRGQAIWDMAVNCTNGTTGELTFSADYLSTRDIVVYRLSNGENGFIDFVAS